LYQLFNQRVADIGDHAKRSWGERNFDAQIPLKRGAERLNQTLHLLMKCRDTLTRYPGMIHGSLLKEANLPLVLHPTDARIKCLEEHYLLEIARCHGRSLADPASAPISPEEHVSSLSASIPCEPDLIQRVSSLETKVAQLQEHLAELALALLAEREHAFERRVVSLEAMMAQLLGKSIVSSSLPQEPLAASSPSASVPRVLNPAEQQARLRMPVEPGTGVGRVV